MSFATRLAVCALAVSSSACSVWQPLVPTPGPVPAAIESVTVPQLSWLGAGGTGIRVGECHFLSARHVVREFMTDVDIGGIAAAIEVLQHGQGTTFDQDWTYFRSDASVPSAESIMPTDFETPLQIGEEVYAIGYGWLEGEREGDEPNRLPCFVNTPPYPLPARTFAIRPPTTAPRRGMSGGPIVVLRDGHPIVVGIIHGVGEFTHDPATQLILAIRPELELPGR